MAFAVSTTFLALAAFSTLGYAQTWAEQLQLIGSNGNYTGSHDYIRAYFPSGNPDFSDTKNTSLLSPERAEIVLTLKTLLAVPKSSHDRTMLAATQGSTLRQAMISLSNTSRTAISLSRTSCLVSRKMEGLCLSSC